MRGMSGSDVHEVVRGMSGSDVGGCERHVRV